MADMDLVTKRINAALNIVLFSYPKRTSFGLLIGFVPLILIHTFKSNIEAKGISIDWLHYLACELIGVLLMNLKSIYEAFEGSSIDEAFSNTLKSIEKNTTLSNQEKRELITKTLAAQIDSLSTDQVEKVQKQIIEK